MAIINCCRSSYWSDKITDLGKISSFEFVLKQCGNCGAYWMDVFCTASNTSDYEPVSENEAQIFLDTFWGPELKKIVDEWFKSR